VFCGDTDKPRSIADSPAHDRFLTRKDREGGREGGRGDLPLEDKDLERRTAVEKGLKRGTVATDFPSPNLNRKAPAEHHEYNKVSRDGYLANH
jgi:hypothetical protein